MFGNNSPLGKLVQSIKDERDAAATNGPTSMYPGPRPEDIKTINERLTGAGIGDIFFADAPRLIVHGRCRCMDPQHNPDHLIYVERYGDGVTRLVTHEGPNGPRITYVGSDGKLGGHSLTTEQQELIEELARDYAANPPYPVS